MDNLKKTEISLKKEIDILTTRLIIITGCG